MPYGTAASAAAISGLLAADISSDVLSLTDTLINSWMNRDYGFDGVQTKSNHLLDVPFKSNSLFLPDWPIVTVSELINDAQSSNPITVNSDSYVVELLSGLIQLKPSQYNSVSNNWIVNFAAGLNSVKVSYTYGYAVVPDRIKKLANLVAAKLAKSIKYESNRPAGGVQSIKIGDYEERFSSDTTEMEKMLSTFETQIMKGCVRDFKVIV